MNIWANLRLGCYAMILALAAAAPCLAGPPYITDDPEPTDLGHWEIYAFGAGDGRGSDFDGNAGLDLNYGAVKDVQLTATLPLGITRGTGSDWRIGTDDLELGVKYRFLAVEQAGVSAAVFPRVILPTSSLASGGKTRLLLPVWLQKDAGRTSIFGGGGYEINPGAGNRDFWQAGLAVTREVGRKASLGGEIAWQGRDADDSPAQTSIGLGTTVSLGGPFAFLFSAGPTWSGGQTRYHFYSALGINF